MKKHISIGVLAVALCAAAAHANAEVVVVVSAQSPVGKLSKDQVNAVFLNKTKEFPDGAGVPLLVALANGPAREEFVEKVLGKTDSQAKAYWAKLTFTGSGSAPRELSDANELKKLVAANPNAIGFVDKGVVDSSLKVVFTP